VAVSPLPSRRMNDVVQPVWSHREGPSCEPDAHSLPSERREGFSLPESDRSIGNELECMKHVKTTELHALYLIFLKQCFFVLPR